MNLTKLIRDIPDFPEPGIVFKDITPLLKSVDGFRYAIEMFSDRYRECPVDAVVGVEARGFFFAAPVALALGKPFIPIRKQGKLPSRTRSIAYELEYGTGVVEMHEDAISPGSNVLLMDDLLATGGTLGASAKLIEQAGGNVVEIAVLIELLQLRGHCFLEGYQLYSLLRL